jgi:hypothetical protein
MSLTSVVGKCQPKHPAPDGSGMMTIRWQSITITSYLERSITIV